MGFGFTTIVKHGLAHRLRGIANVPNYILLYQNDQRSCNQVFINFSNTFQRF